MYLRGIRGAITVAKNTKEDILKETSLLLKETITQNAINIDDIASIFFSITRDLDQAFPAISARNLGLINTALLCFNEVEVPGSLEKCIRVLFHINTKKSQNEIKHVYLKGAQTLRPDLHGK